MCQREPIKFFFHSKAGPVVPEEKILSGRSAEMVGYRSSSDDEDAENMNAPRHRFTQPDHVKMLLKSEALKLFLLSSVLKPSRYYT